MDIGFLAAVLGGVLALLSPCSALLLPSFFAYAFRDPGRLLLRTSVFYAGLCLTLIPLGAGSAMVSMLFYGHRETLINVAGAVIIVFGVLQILGLGFTWAPLARAQGRFAAGRGHLSVLGLGAVYGLAGFCSGPILGAVLTVAATGTPLRGMFLMAAYALGMVLPMFVLALLWDRYDLGRRRWLRGRSVRLGPLTTHTTALLSGGLFIGIGVLFIAFDGTASMAGLPGMAGAEQLAYRAQESLSRLGTMTDLVALVLGAVVVGGSLVFTWRSRHRASADADGHETSGKG
ncbi:MAG TPA: cytochrome c biogenesis CcdA family protein [Nocardiopsis listeri]|uniref:cytochrome c biogenesis CcdA family protein n=1 Tax=Nocardiopsis listeri TaxID=53440 RepID=UPI001D539540|nr:cytochrome c biogenesis CcdA family protein [Nocardiopsis listeri]HJE58076.1 cytochrome c biogenesis CcdA family protein [Nocardiopsis listeri]